MIPLCEFNDKLLVRNYTHLSNKMSVNSLNWQERYDYEKDSDD